MQFSDIWKNQTIQHFELFQDKERFFHSFAWAVAGRSHYLLRKRLTLLQLPPADFDWYENLKDMTKIENMIKDNSWSIHFRVNKDWIPLSANKRIVSKCKCLERLHKLYFQFDSQCTILFWNSGNSNFIKGFTDMPDQKDSCTGLVDLFVTDRFHARLSTAVFLNHRLTYISLIILNLSKHLTSCMLNKFRLKFCVALFRRLEKKYILWRKLWHICWKKLLEVQISLKNPQTGSHLYNSKVQYY